MSRVVTFGDSWPYGHELSSFEKPYGAVLAEMLSMEFLNCARPATSNEHMILQLKKYIESPNLSDDTLAIFFITSPSRTLLIDFDGTEKEIYPWEDQSRGSHAHAWYKFFHTPYQEEFRTNLSILSLQRMCEQNSIKDYYIVGWNNIHLNYPGIDKSKIYSKTCAELFGASTDDEFTQATENLYVKPNICHPNQKGHNLIAEILMEWISNDRTVA